MIFVVKVDTFMKRTFDTSVQAFASHVARTGSASTARKYEEAVNKFLKSLKVNGITRYEDLSPGILQQYVDSIIDDYAPSSIQVYLSGVKKYLDWVRKQGVHVPELLEPDTPKITHRVRDALSPADIGAYLNHAQSMLVEPARTAAMLLPCTGLRAQEMSDLPLQSLHKVSVKLKNGTYKNTFALRVIGKGDKERSVPILDEGVEILTAYLAGWRRTRGGPWVFPGMQSKKNKGDRFPMSVRLLRDGLIKVREPLGLQITPHTMRRTYLTALWRKGVDPATIAKIAGHSNIQTLFKHYLALDEQDILGVVHQHGASFQ